MRDAPLAADILQLPGANFNCFASCATGATANWARARAIVAPAGRRCPGRPRRRPTRRAHANLSPAAGPLAPAKIQAARSLACELILISLSRAQTGAARRRFRRPLAGARIHSSQTGRRRASITSAHLHFETRGPRDKRAPCSRLTSNLCPFAAASLSASCHVGRIGARLCAYAPGIRARDASPSGAPISRHTPPETRRAFVTGARRDLYQWGRLLARAR